MIHNLPTGVELPRRYFISQLKRGKKKVPDVPEGFSGPRRDGQRFELYP